MRDSEFEFIRTLVYKRSRISLDQNKRELVAARLAKRLRATCAPTVADYCRVLRSPEGEEERSRLIDAISTNHTYFFREAVHFEKVRGQIAPELAARSKTDRWTRLNAWSAACSSGEEAYSLAMALSAGLGEAPVPWRVEASDISHRMLEAARPAIYRCDAVETHAPAWARRHFQRGVGAQEGNFRVSAPIRARIAFRQLNLMGGPFPYAERFHLIFCRNVMIYFDRPTQEELLRRLSDQLVPGGYLIVGLSESLAGIRPPLTRVEPSIYRRQLAA